MSHESWRPIAGYEGFYEVSDLGRVRSVDRTITDSNGKRFNKRGKVLKPHYTGRGKYLSIGLHKSGNQKTFTIHQLVANAFLPRDDSSLEVDHINADKYDNRAVNLRWVSHTANMKYMYDAGHYNGSYKEMLAPEVRLKLMPKLRKRVIRDDGVEFESITAAAEAIGRTRNAVGRVVGNPTMRCNGHTFRFAD